LINEACILLLLVEGRKLDTGFELKPVLGFPALGLPYIDLWPKAELESTMVAAATSAVPLRSSESEFFIQFEVS